MQATIIDAGGREAWNEFLLNAPHPQILQSFEWGELKSHFGWIPVRIALCQGKEIKAAASCLKRKLPRLNKSIFYIPRGPAVDLYDKQLFDGLLEAIVREAEKENAILVKIDPFVLEEDARAVDILKAEGFLKKKKQIQPRVTFCLDLRSDPEALLASFEEKTRYNIRLSERKGVSVREDKSASAVELFCRMYRETAKRDNFLVHPDAYYSRIKENIIDRGLGTIFAAYFKGVPIASVIIFNFGKTIWYMYGASLGEHRNVMPNHALHWHVINWAKQNGFETYDLWGIPANPNPSHPLWGVYKFKKGFNGKLVKLIGAYDKPLNKVYYHLFDKGLSLWQGARSLLTKGKISDSLGE